MNDELQHVKKRRDRIGVLGGLFLLTSAACGSSTNANANSSASIDAGHVDADARPPFTEEDIRAAQGEFNGVLCPAWERCDPSGFHLFFGSMAGCIDSPQTFVLGINGAATGRGLYGHGSLLTPDAVRACAKALDFSTCEAFVFNLEGILPDVCRPLQYGTLPNDSPCAASNQCASGQCIVLPSGPSAYHPYGGPSPGQCGRCVPEQPVGAPCFDFWVCAPGSVCLGATDGTSSLQAPRRGVCTRIRNVGESCINARCHPHLVCVDGTCAVPPANNACDVAAGIIHTCSELPYGRICNPETKTCEPIPLAKDNEPCGYEPFTLCNSGSTCTWIPESPAVKDPPIAAKPRRLVCRPRIEDGHACNVLDHPFQDEWEDYFGLGICKNPESTCFQGICQRHGPAECSPPPVLP